MKASIEALICSCGHWWHLHQDGACAACRCSRELSENILTVRERRLREALTALVTFYDGGGVISQPEYTTYKTLAELIQDARAALAKEPE